MSLANRITSLLTSLTVGQVGAMPPTDRQLLSDQCRRVLQLAESSRTPKGGVLADLRDGKGRQ
jgi:hypothetical protein